MIRQREHKFEVWDKEKKRMSHPFKIFAPYIIWQDGTRDRTSSLIAFFNEATGKERFEFREATGAKDKRGRMMYEWDIVKAHSTVGLVVWNNDLSLFEISVKLEGAEGDYSATIYSHRDETTGNFTEREVIGNIYETPEKLLEPVTVKVPRPRIGEKK